MYYLYYVNLSSINQCFIDLDKSSYFYVYDISERISIKFLHNGYLIGIYIHQEAVKYELLLNNYICKEF